MTLVHLLLSFVVAAAWQDFLFSAQDSHPWTPPSPQDIVDSNDKSAAEMEHLE